MATLTESWPKNIHLFIMHSESEVFRHSGLSRIASLVTVRDIYTPFIAAFDASRDGGGVFEEWGTELCGEACPLDQMALVLQNGKPSGTLTYDALEAGKPVYQCMDDIRLDTLITEDTSLTRAAEMFARSDANFFVVINGNDMVGWLSYHDLYKLPFRLCLFAELLAVEGKMLQVAQQDAKCAFQKLPEGRRSAASRLYQLRGLAKDDDGGEAPRSLVTCTNFIDKATILQRCVKTRRCIPTAGEKKWMLRAEKVRNALAHPNPAEYFVILVKRKEFGGFITWLARLDMELTAFLATGPSQLD